LASATAPLLSYLTNGGFEEQAVGWTVDRGTLVQDVTASGAAALRLTSGSAYQDLLDLEPGQVYTVAGSWKWAEVTPTTERGYAYLAIYQWDDFGDLLAFCDFAQATGTHDWERRSYTFTVAEGARIVSLRCGLFQATGTVWLDDFTLVAGSQAAAFQEVQEAATTPAALPGLERQARGNVAIWGDPVPLEGAEGISSDPQRLAAALRAEGFGVALLEARQMADKAILNRATFDVLILPHGPAFPVEAADNFRRFLKQGGKFLSLGGYAFDLLLERTEAGWQRYQPLSSPSDVRWHCHLPADSLRGRGDLTFSGWIKTLNVGGDHFAFLAIYQYDSHGQLVQWKDLCQVRGTTDWTEVKETFNVHPQAATVDLQAGLWECYGVAWFDDLQITDEAGNLLLSSDFEADFNPDSQEPGNWWCPAAPYRNVAARGGRGGGRALQAKLPRRPVEERLNTRSGTPGDSLAVASTQLGVFDPDYRLERAVAAVPAPDQNLFPPDYRLDGPLTGYAASGVVGFNAARWVPLLNATDRYGRLRGAAGALLRHYAGTWAGSSWAFFGVTNRDVLAEEKGTPPFPLARLIDALVQDVYLAAVRTEPACVRPGETVRITAPVFNGGRQPAEVEVTFEVLPDGSEEPAYRTTVAVHALPQQCTDALVEWSPGDFAADFYTIRVGLQDRTGEGREIDVCRGGLVAWHDSTIAQGPDLRLRNNYLHYGERPLFLFGTDDWYYVFGTDRETPLQWREDMEKRRDFGVMIYENLQVGWLRDPQEQERFFRKCDGVVQLSQQFGQVYFAGLLIGANVAVSEAELAEQCRWVRAFAERYKDVPGLIYYLNGDLRCQLNDAILPQWRSFLRERYGTLEKLQEAWGPVPFQSFEEIPVTDYADWNREWEDLKAYDYNLFRAWLIRRWTGALIQAIHEVDPGALTSCEFYQLPHAGVDLPAGIGDLDLSNIGYFDKPLEDLRRFPKVLKYSDQRARGKSLGPGEYGVKTHPAWGDGKDYGYHITRTREQALDLFLAIPHYSLGLGASRIHNWCWKDSAHHIFPWGMTYPCDNVEKDILRVHRNQSLLFRHFAPVYEEPTVYFLTADSHRLGGSKWQVLEGLLNGIQLALSAHVDNLGVLHEHGLRIPDKAQVIFYPLPYCPTDEAYAQLLAFVRRGGTLYLSGDLSYDQLRRRTRTERLEELCGVRFVAENYPNIRWGDRPPQYLADTPGIAGTFFGAKAAWPGYPGITVEPAGAEPIGWAYTSWGGPPTPALFHHRIGAGQVIYCTDPLELHADAASRPGHRWLYRRVLELAGVAPLGLEPDDPDLHVFRVPLQDGGQVWILFNADETQSERTVTLTAVDPPVTLTLKRQRPGLLWYDGAGRLRAVETQGTASRGGQPLTTDGTHGLALALEEADLREAKSLLFFPLQAGEITLSTQADWQHPVAEVGEVRRGVWQPLETLPIAVRHGQLHLTLTADQALSLVWVGEERPEWDRWRQEIGRRMREPGRW